MAHTTPSSPANAALFTVSSLLLAILGGAFAMRPSGRGAPDGAVDAVAARVDHPRMWLRLPVEAADARGSAVELAARRMALAWEEFGLECSLTTGTDEPSQAFGVVVIPAAFPATGPEEATLWASLGIRHEGGNFITGRGHAFAGKSVAAAVTLTASQFERAGGRLAPLGLAEVLPVCAGTITVVMGESAASTSVARALDALARERPPIASRVVLWSDGQRVFDAEVEESAHAVLPGDKWPLMRSVAPVAVANGAAGGDDLLARAEEIASTVRAHKGSAEAAQTPRLVRVPGLDVRARDGAVHRTGWYDSASHALVVFEGVAASEDDALFGYAEAELLRVLGLPASPWFARGIAHTLVGRCGGLALAEIESRAGGVTPGEVMAEARRRSRVSLAPAEVRLARCLLSDCGGDVERAWALPVADDADLQGRLRELWKTSLLRSPIEVRRAEPRRLPGGLHVELKASGVALTGPGLLAALDRIAAQGFSGVALEVHVPVAPPAAPERLRSTPGLGGWGRHVTIEGDGAVLACAAAAHGIGLAVTLVPMFITGESGGPGRRQIHGSAERIRLYGDRRALAMEGVAWLAEQAGAEALVMFEPEDLPHADPESDGRWTPEIQAAYGSTRRQSLAYSAPFAGERIAFARGEKARGKALEELSSPRFRALFTGPLSQVGLSVGIAKGRRWVLDASNLEVVGPWFVGDAESEWDDLGEMGDEALRRLVDGFSGAAAQGASRPARPR